MSYPCSIKACSFLVSAFFLIEFVLWFYQVLLTNLNPVLLGWAQTLVEQVQALVSSSICLESVKIIALMSCYFGFYGELCLVFEPTDCLFIGEES